MELTTWQRLQWRRRFFGEAICYRIPLRIQTKMEPRWERHGVFLKKLDLSYEVIVGTTKGIETTQSFRRMPVDQQWNPETMRMVVGVPWNARGFIAESLEGIRKLYITRSLVQERGATQPATEFTSLCAKMSQSVSRHL